MCYAHLQLSYNILLNEFKVDFSIHIIYQPQIDFPPRPERTFKITVILEQSC